VDRDVRRQKQQALMVQMVERKIRSRAQQLYEARGKPDGCALEDWVQAETEVLEKSILAPLYYRTKMRNWPTNEFADLPTREPGRLESCVGESC
jgi:hypothetical protein